MLREFLSIFTKQDAMREMGDSFTHMLRLTGEMTSTAGEIYFRSPVAPEERTRLYEQDVQVNMLEREIRKRIVTHLSLQLNRVDIPYCLLLMSLTKDAERIGDYGKNLSEVVDIYPGPLDDDEILGELREIRAGTDRTSQALPEVLDESDRERAIALIHEGKDFGARADGLLSRIARLDYTAGQTTALVLGARYYKRLGGHMLNILSSVVMPLHKVDYFDEDEVIFRSDSPVEMRRSSGKG